MTSTDSSSETVVLYRPVGQAELDLIEQSDYKGFPPRLPQQPIFYPVLTETYAEQIAREWNTADPVSGYVGYVTRFEVEKSYIDRFEVHQVGGPDNLEYWVPPRTWKSSTATSSVGSKSSGPLSERGLEMGLSRAAPIPTVRLRLAASVSRGRQDHLLPPCNRWPRSDV